MKLRISYPEAPWWVVALAGTITAIGVFFLFRFLWKEWTLIALAVSVPYVMGGVGWRPKQPLLHAVFIGNGAGIFFTAVDLTYLLVMSP